MKRALKGIFVWTILQALAVSVSACPECRAKVRDGIHGQDFSANLFVLLLPVVVVIAVGVGLYLRSGRHDHAARGEAA